ncbi:hypothetical protein C8R43DRAFT_1122742 [Mycena crocata]|nr:hypothetical protein C8R43DRAFT_1122742 [Mycena crocata]
MARSADSTISEVHAQYGTVPPTQELYRMIARLDYGKSPALIDPAAYNSVMKSLHTVETPNPRPYRVRERGAIPTIRENELESLATAALAASADSGAMGVGVRFAEPAFIPVPLPRPDTISALPSAGFIQSTRSAPSQASVAGGPSVMLQGGVIGRGGVPPSFNTVFAPAPTPAPVHRADPGRTTYTYKMLPVTTVASASMANTPAPYVPTAWKGETPNPDMRGDGYPGDGDNRG